MKYATINHKQVEVCGEPLIRLEKVEAKDTAMGIVMWSYKCSVCGDAFRSSERNRHKNDYCHRPLGKK
jgi:hypothetical protein